MQRDLFDLDESSRRLSRNEIADAKQRHPGMVLLFRVGDRYELFGDDAVLGATVLGLQLVEPAGDATASFPWAELESNLRRLLHLGHRVAICDSQENHT